ncbi:hypothetical protein U0070_027724, partial [Myodes glareolus]
MVKLRKCIHCTGEHPGLGQEKRDLFGGSDPHCSGHFQNHSDLVINCTFLVSSIYTTLIMPGKVMRIIKIFWTVTNHFSIWFATCLSILYFLKIANFSSYIFLYLKWRVEKVILVTLLVSLHILVLNILVINTHIDVWIDGLDANVSYSAIIKNSTEFSRLVLLVNTMFTLTPFTVSLTLFLLLIFSLWRHLKNMQHNSKGSRDVSTRAHIKALHMVVTFLPFMCPDPSEQEAESILTFCAIVDEVQAQRYKM